MPKGGYKLINMRGADITSDGVKVDGLYNSIESNNGKPIMFQDFSLTGTEVGAMWVPLRSVGATFQGLITVNIQGTEAVKIVVKQDDTVSIHILTAIINDPMEQEEPSASM